MVINNGICVQYGRTSGTFSRGEQNFEQITLPITYIAYYSVLNTLRTSPNSTDASYCVSVINVNNSTIQCVHNGAIPGYHFWLTIGY